MVMKTSDRRNSHQGPDEGRQLVGGTSRRALRPVPDRCTCRSCDRRTLPREGLRAAQIADQLRNDTFLHDCAAALGHHPSELGLPRRFGRGALERLRLDKGCIEGGQVVGGRHPPRHGPVPADRGGGGAQAGPVEVTAPMDRPRRLTQQPMTRGRRLTFGTDQRRNCPPARRPPRAAPRGSRRHRCVCPSGLSGHR